MRVDDSRIRKEKVADSKISGYVWTGPDSNAEQRLQMALAHFMHEYFVVSKQE